MPSVYWDWALYFYVGTVILQMTPQHFWRCTPRKFNALCRVHARLNDSGDKKKPSAVSKQPDTYIDQVL